MHELDDLTEKELRLECLRLAVEVDVPAWEVLILALKFYGFVQGYNLDKPEGQGRQAPG